MSVEIDKEDNLQILRALGLPFLMEVVLLEAAGKHVFVPTYRSPSFGPVMDTEAVHITPAVSHLLAVSVLYAMVSYGWLDWDRAGKDENTGFIVSTESGRIHARRMSRVASGRALGVGSF